MSLNVAYPRLRPSAIFPRDRFAPANAVDNAVASALSAPVNFIAPNKPIKATEIGLESAKPLIIPSIASAIPFNIAPAK